MYRMERRRKRRACLRDREQYGLISYKMQVRRRYPGALAAKASMTKRYSIYPNVLKSANRREDRHLNTTSPLGVNASNLTGILQPGITALLPFRV